MAEGLQEVTAAGPSPIRQNIVTSDSSVWRSLSGHVVAHPEKTQLFRSLSYSTLIGVMMIIPIGARICHRDLALNSYCRTFRGGKGLVLDSKLLIIAGALDGVPADSFRQHVEAMNRSFTNVLFGLSGRSRRSAAGNKRRAPCAAQRRRKQRPIPAAANKWSSCRVRNGRCAAQHKSAQLYDALTKRARR